MIDSLIARLGRSRLGDWSRVTSRRTMAQLGVVAVVSFVMSLIEVGALAMMVPLIELLSGGELEDAGLPGEFAARLLGDWTRRSQAMAVLLVMVGLLVTKVVIAAATRWWTIAVITKGSTTASTNLVAAYLAAPLEFHTHRNSAAASRSALISMTLVYTSGLLGATIIFTELCAILFLGALLVFVSPLSAGAAILYFGIALVVFNRVVQRRVAERARARDEVYTRFLTELQHGLGMLREIRLRGDEWERIKLFEQRGAERRALERVLMFGAEVGRFYMEAMFFIGFGIIASILTLTRGESAFADLGIILATGFRLLPSASRLLYGVNTLRQGEGSLSTVTEELDAMGVRRLQPPVPREAHPRSTGRPRPATVELSGVTFAYAGADRPAVSDVSFVIRPGESLGIVGPSGSGKSTILDLICGFIEPDSGTIAIDGRRVTHDGQRPSIGYIPQDIFLLDGSVRENIALSDNSVDEEALRRAVRQAQLEDWLAALPKGLDTLVGERGALVSGGQRQRIGIARALYTQPALLIMDEATSALDVETEAELTAAISGLGDTVTLIVVAHRLSTVRTCDQVLVMSGGRMTGLASYDELSSGNAMFSKWISLANAEAPGR